MFPAGARAMGVLLAAILTAPLCSQTTAPSPPTSKPPPERLPRVIRVSQPPIHKFPATPLPLASDPSSSRDSARTGRPGERRDAGRTGERDGGTRAGRGLWTREDGRAERDAPFQRRGDTAARIIRRDDYRSDRVLLPANRLRWQADSASRLYGSDDVSARNSLDDRIRRNLYARSGWEDYRWRRYHDEWRWRNYHDWRSRRLHDDWTWRRWYYRPYWRSYYAWPYYRPYYLWPYSGSPFLYPDGGS